MTNTNHQVIGAMKIELSGKEVASMQGQEVGSMGRPQGQEVGSMGRPQGQEVGSMGRPQGPRKDRIFFGKVCKLHWSVQGIIIIILPEHLFNVISNGTHEESRKIWIKIS